MFDRKLSSILLASSLVLLATTALGAPPSSGSGPAATAALTLSGAHNGSASCVPTAAWRASDNRGALSFTVPKGFGAGIDFTATMSFSGEPVAGTMTETTTGLDYAIQAVQAKSYWVAASNGTGYSASQQPAKGTVKIVITSVAVASSTADGKTYTAHGTIDATLPPLPGTNAKANETAHLTF